MKRLKRTFWIIIAHLWSPIEIILIIKNDDVSQIGEYIDEKIDKYY